MQLAARVLAASAWDLYHSPNVLALAKAELVRRMGDCKYEPLTHPGQKPAFDYRNPPNNRRAAEGRESANDER